MLGFIKGKKKEKVTGKSHDKKTNKQNHNEKPKEQKNTSQRDPSAYYEEMTKWLSSNNNVESIKYLSTNNTEHCFHLTIGEEKLAFEVTYPVEPDDVWCVSSDDLSEDWVNNTLEFAMGAATISEVLLYATQQFSALSDEELSSGDEEDDEEDEFDDEIFCKEENDPKPKKCVQEPLIDTNKFIIPSGYEPGAVQAIIQQYKDILKTDRSERGYDAAPLNDNIAQWEIKLFQIPKDEPLWLDMQKLGHSHITMHVTFPPNFPFSPPFIRVVRPRFAFRTGHITVGGSICTLMLTNDGWIATYRLDQVMVDIGAMLTSGGGRLDMSNTSDYGEDEAMMAFKRMLHTHGWKHWKE